MTCAICGNALPCAHSRRNTAVLLEETGINASDRRAGPAASHLPEGNDQQQWRREVISRVQQHRARRRKRFNPDAPELDFSSAEPFYDHEVPASAKRDGGDLSGAEHRPAFPREDARIRILEEFARPAPPKIIRFPASPFSRMTPPAEVTGAIKQELAAPRILDASQDAAIEDAEIEEMSYVAPVMHRAEQMELLPCFDDIHLDEPPRKTVDVPELIPRPAPLGQRMIAAAIDLAVVTLAAMAFKIAFLQLAEDNPQSKMALLCAVAVGGALWLLYQYLFLVHGERTPGMLVTGLELATFEGKPVGRKGRRLRALASGLSGFSLGLGYGWALVDEDQLGWHDRMTGTLMKSSTQQSAISTQPGSN